MKRKLLVFMTALAMFWPLLAGASALRDFQNQPQQLSDYTGQGKWLVVMMWASDCHVCNDEAYQYEAFHKNFKDKNARVLGVTLDGDENRQAAQAFIKRNGVTFPNLIGEPMDVIGMYQSLTESDWVGTPTFLIYDPKGELVARQAGAVPASLIEQFISGQSE